ncbi:MAG: tRNA (N6-isopentenyl adenosine(37)-C2)-methylthiotransferase MiaB, partial [Desulfovibrio sp.]|nr:tRNA (N6-isopentenyl adenosine(37)-C2)-methylthiotransferase MiaB [Desulfovibrio sp.]
MPPWTFHILTFGCKVNQYESHAIREAWQAQGASEVAAPEAADVVLINSCAVTGRAERDARNAVFRVRRAAPGARIILAGCAAELFAAFR